MPTTSPTRCGKRRCRWRAPAASPQASAREGHIGGGPLEAAPAAPEEVIVKLESEPAGAVAMLDGTMLCQSTPCSKLVIPGAHEFSFQKEGYDPSTQGAQAV